MALGPIWALNILLAGLSAALLGGLVYVYGRNASKIRSKFTLGLVVFAALLLAENVAGMWAYMSMNNAGEGPSTAIPMLVLNAIETGALVTLFAVTWE